MELIVLLSVFGNFFYFHPNGFSFAQEICGWETLDWIGEWFFWTAGLVIWILNKLVWIAVVLILLYVSVLRILQRFTPNYASKLGQLAEYLTVRFVEKLLSSCGILGDQSKQMILFVPNADQQLDERWSNYKNKSNGSFEISQDALSRHLLSDTTANLIDELNSDGSSQTFDKTMYDMLCYLYKNDRNDFLLPRRVDGNF